MQNIICSRKTEIIFYIILGTVVLLRTTYIITLEVKRDTVGELNAEHIL